MMFSASFHSRKRGRSPPDVSMDPSNSPVLGITSPTVDVLAKRQRVTTSVKTIGGVLEQINVQDQISPMLYEAGSSQDRSNDPGGNSRAQNNASDLGNGHEDVAQYAEKRRTRQWEQLNAPRLTTPYITPPFLTPSNTSQCQKSTDTDESQELGYFAPATHHASQPQRQSRPAFKQHMSSSPIRHQPPGSSPFKSSGSSSQNTIKDFRSSAGTPSGQILDDGDDDEDEERMDEDELRSHWGEHYARPNGLLLSVHKSRQSQPRIPPATPRIPPRNGSFEHNLASPFRRPGSARVLSYRHEATHATDHINHQSGPSNEDVDMQYEETNRLLGQLELARRQRTNTQ